MKTTIHSTLAAALMVVFTTASVPSHAGLFSDDEARRAVLELRSRIDASNVRIDSKADKSSTLDLANQNDQLRTEIAKLRGQIEVLSNELANAQRRQKDFYVDLDNRMRKLEPQKVVVDGKEASVQPSEQLAYDAALATFKAADYKRAGVAFSDFLRRYPQSGYAASAQYWLGNAYYAQRDYKNAIATQQLVVQNYPDNPKAADAMLNIASCYTELKDKANARKTLDKLIAQYPDSAIAQTAKERLSALQ